MIIETINGIGLHEYERDMEIGDEMEAKLERLKEEVEIDPTDKNIDRCMKLALELNAYAVKIEEKYTGKKVK